jgi:hypothetical protein
VQLEIRKLFELANNDFSNTFLKATRDLEKPYRLTSILPNNNADYSASSNLTGRSR